MLVRVKDPHIEVIVRGEGTEHIAQVLQRVYEGAEICDEEDEGSVPIEDTDWYKSRAGLMTSGKSLRIYRTNAGLTMTQLSDATGISKSNISLMEHDKRPIGKTVAKKLADVLGCDYRSLLLIALCFLALFFLSKAGGGPA